MRSRALCGVILLLLLGGLAGAQESALTYTVRQEGKIVGFLHYRPGGRLSYDETVDDWKGAVVFEEKESAGTYTGVTTKDQVQVSLSARVEKNGITVEQKVGGATRSKTFTLDRLPLIFTGSTPHPLLSISKEFPKKEGGIFRFPVVNPETLSSFEGTVEYEGERVIAYEGDLVKARYYVAAIGDNGVSLYEDSAEKFFLLEMPLDGKSWHLTDYTPQSFPFANGDKLPRTDRHDYTAKQVAIRGSQGKLLNGELFLPAGKGPFPAAILLPQGPGLDKNGNPTGNPHMKPDTLLELAEFLSNRAIATLRYDEPINATSLELANDARQASLWLSAQRELDPSRVFVIANGAGGETALMAAEKNPELAALVLISPTSKLLAALPRIGIPILIVQGADENPTLLQQASDLAQNGKGNQKIERITVPGVDYELRKPTRLEGPAAYIDPERRVSETALSELLNRLLNAGL